MTRSPLPPGRGIEFSDGQSSVEDTASTDPTALIEKRQRRIDREWSRITFDRRIGRTATATAETGAPSLTGGDRE